VTLNSSVIVLFVTVESLDLGCWLCARLRTTLMFLWSLKYLVTVKVMEQQLI
jgi:hypothetical protein